MHHVYKRLSVFSKLQQSKPNSRLPRILEEEEGWREIPLETRTSMKNPSSFTPLLLFLLVACAGDNSGRRNSLSSIPVGVNYFKRSQDGDPSAVAVASTLRSMEIGRVLLTAADTDTIQAFSYTGISLLLSLPNAYIPRFASNVSAACIWARDYVAAVYPRARVTMVSVGSDVISVSPDLADFVLPAIRNVHRALRDLGLPHVSVSTTVSFDVIASPIPPSSAEFHQSDSFFSPLLGFLSSINSSFLVNLFPYNVFRSDPSIPIGFALFKEEPFGFRDDQGTGIRYRNLFDVMVDGVINAMAVLGYGDIPLVVTQTGWPSSGDANEPEADLFYAKMYNTGIIRHLQEGIAGITSPTKRDAVPETYLYSLLDVPSKGGDADGRGWGILYPSLTKKYDLDFSGVVPSTHPRVKSMVKLVFLVSATFFFD